MNVKLDELAKHVARSVTRRSALKKFGVVLAGIALTSLGLVKNAQAGQGGGKAGGNCNHCSGDYGCAPNDVACMQRCAKKCCVICPK
jgi:hypothetical protein